MENKNKNLIFLCDINGTITSCYANDEKTAFHDAFHGTTEVRQKNLVKLAQEIVELKKIEGCDDVYFSFFSGEDRDVIIYRVNEVKKIFDEYGIQIRLCGCNSTSFSGYMFFEDDSVIYKEEKEKNNKVSLITGIIDTIQKNDCVVYADDSRIDRRMVENYFLRKDYRNFTAVDSDCIIDGEKKRGLRGLVMHLDELLKLKKIKNKR